MAALYRDARAAAGRRDRDHRARKRFRRTDTAARIGAMEPARLLQQHGSSRVRADGIADAARAESSSFRQSAVVHLPVEPIAITADPLLHGDIGIGLIERNAGDIIESRPDELPDHF